MALTKRAQALPRSNSSAKKGYATRPVQSKKKSAVGNLKKASPRGPVAQSSTPISKASGQRQTVGQNAAQTAAKAAAARAAAAAIQRASQQRSAVMGKQMQAPNPAQRARALAFNAANTGVQRAQAGNVARAAATLASPKTATNALPANRPAAQAPSYDTDAPGGPGSETYTPPVSRPVAPTPETQAPTAPRPVAPTPQVQAPSQGGTPSNVGRFTTVGTPGTFGSFQRQRLNRGPRGGVSVTPELLRRIAAQRIQRG
jgi:hypothetical protein